MNPSAANPSRKSPRSQRESARPKAPRSRPARRAEVPAKRVRPSRAPHIPDATINRLSVYGRVLQQMDDEGLILVSSAALAARCGFNPAQIRKDLAYFGGFGIRGVGYRVRELRESLRRIMGVTRRWKVALVGAGNLGSALLAYQGFAGHGFDFAAVFDKYPARSRRGRSRDIEVLPMNVLPRVIRERGIQIGIIAVPAAAAQEVADCLVEADVSGILNFAPTRLSVPYHVKLRNVDLGLELEGLAYYLSRGERDARERRRRGGS